MAQKVRPTKIYHQATMYPIPLRLYFGEGDSCIDANNNGLCDVPTPDDGTPADGYEYEETNIYELSKPVLFNQPEPYW
ncbi:hypothetical protein P4S68_06455 [Pseudoalteromonas sp. Hal099]